MTPFTTSTFHTQKACVYFGLNKPLSSSGWPRASPEKRGSPVSIISTFTQVKTLKTFSFHFFRRVQEGVCCCRACEAPTPGGVDALYSLRCEVVGRSEGSLQVRGRLRNPESVLLKSMSWKNIPDWWNAWSICRERTASEQSDKMWIQASFNKLAGSCATVYLSGTPLPEYQTAYAAPT